jgi:DNA-binding NarL/FixJ family response regulator
MIKVIAIDDHQLVLEGLKIYFKQNQTIEIAAVFHDGQSAVPYIINHSPDVLLLDLHLAAEDGLDLCKTFHKQFPQLKIIILTSIEQAKIVQTAIKHGAHGYLLKNCDAHLIEEAILTVYQGNIFLQAEIAKLAIMGKDNPKTQYIPLLSRREKEVLALIINEMTTKEIAEKLFLSVDTVESHRANLIQKLGAKNVAGLVRIALEKGLV